MQYLYVYSCSSVVGLSVGAGAGCWCRRSAYAAAADLIFSAAVSPPVVKRSCLIMAAILFVKQNVY